MTKKYITAQKNQVPTKLTQSEFRGIGWRIQRDSKTNEFERQEFVRLTLALLEGNIIVFGPELPF